MKKFLLSISVAALLTACNSGLGNKKEETAVTPPPAFTAPAPANPANAINGAASTTTAQLNPAHGKPGHRCDIPEGAPLNSAAIPSMTIPSNNAGVNQTAPTQAIPLPANGSTANLNPEHGKPGHRCDIAVGAPLN